MNLINRKQHLFQQNRKGIEPYDRPRLTRIEKSLLGRDGPV